ncbi:MAG: hypothetical protein A3G24_12635 [Betaproteobacteria bacterium RIFCSPLOWO2_12_FULL_62_13]|nr:MAG: hypothetical protein A3G24_12635 [Betaproteobacteria bacterium RIFCSPLOWO2_12_FULL_62_13]
MSDRPSQTHSTLFHRAPHQLGDLLSHFFELTHPDYPSERLVACRNPQLAELRTAKREEQRFTYRIDKKKVKAEAAFDGISFWSDGTPAHGFRTLLEELSTIVRDTCRTIKGFGARADLHDRDAPNAV